MKHREVILGGLLAAALVAGVLFTKLRQQPAVAGSNPQVDLDLSAADGHMVVDDISVDIAVEPRPARPFEELRFRFRFTKNDAPAEIEDARVSFNMTMDMGPHNYRLVPDHADWVANEVVLPKCGSGSRLWFGALEFRDATTHRARFRIDLAPVN